MLIRPRLTVSSPSCSAALSTRLAVGREVPAIEATSSWVTGSHDVDLALVRFARATSRRRIRVSDGTYNASTRCCDKRRTWRAST